MKTALQHPASHTTYNGHHFSIAAAWHTFINWANKQERNHFLWMAISLLGHGTFFTIVTMTTVILTGNVFALLIATIFTMATVVVVNLAALPTRFTIPILILSLMADITIIITAFCLWLK
jgi:hypothetical protein